MYVGSLKYMDWVLDHDEKSREKLVMAHFLANGQASVRKDELEDAMESMPLDDKGVLAHFATADMNSPLPDDVFVTATVRNVTSPGQGSSYDVVITGPSREDVIAALDADDAFTDWSSFLFDGRV